jgi:hypothetical protein
MKLLRLRVIPPEAQTNFLATPTEFGICHCHLTKFGISIDPHYSDWKNARTRGKLSLILEGALARNKSPSLRVHKESS